MMYPSEKIEALLYLCSSVEPWGQLDEFIFMVKRGNYV